MKSVAREQERSKRRRAVSMIGSFVAGVLLTWTVGIAGSHAAKSEGKASSASAVAIEQPAVDASEQTILAGDANGTDSRRVSGHSELDLQLD
jgi:hypothetical protein